MLPLAWMCYKPICPWGWLMGLVMTRLKWLPPLTIERGECTAQPQGSCLRQSRRRASCIPLIHSHLPSSFSWCTSVNPFVSIYLFTFQQQQPHSTSNSSTINTSSTKVSNLSLLQCNTSLCYNSYLEGRWPLAMFILRLRRRGRDLTLFHIPGACRMKTLPGSSATMRQGESWCSWLGCWSWNWIRQVRLSTKIIMYTFL